MKLHELKPNKGSKSVKKRLGRGNGSGLGTFSGKGVKGQNSRTGGGVRPGFEGGQTPLILRMPKLKGFTNPNRQAFQVVNVDKLNIFEDSTEVNSALLYEKGMISKKNLPVKILGAGDLKKKLTINVDNVSASAQVKIEKAGGKII